jgi:hypothetical protein
VKQPLRLPGLPLCGALLALGLTACEDAPLEPRGFTHETSERVWAAVTVPDEVPHARSLLPYLGGDLRAGAAHEVSALLQEAQRARREGDLLRSWELDASAAVLAAATLERSPDGRLVGEAFRGVDRWLRRVETDVELRSVAELDSAAARVREFRAAAAESLDRGDTLTAVAQLTRGAVVIRRFAPEVVSYRALVQAEILLSSSPGPDRDGERAIHLLRSAREALAEGDGPRALRRALYALQLAGDAAARAVPLEPGS